MNRRPIFRFATTGALAAVLLFASAGPALAQRAFLFVPNIPGDSIVEGYEGWINVLSIRQSATASTRKSIACDISIVKNIDVSGPALWATAANGTVLPEMRVTVLRNAVSSGSGGSTNDKLYDIRLINVRIAGVQATAGGADSSETIALVPQGATLTFYSQTPTGAAGPPVVQSFVCQ